MPEYSFDSATLFKGRHFDSSIIILWRWYITYKLSYRDLRDMMAERSIVLAHNFKAEYVIADKGYDAEAFVLKLKKRNSEVVIPSRVKNKVQRKIDEHVYNPSCDLAALESSRSVI